MHPITMSSGPGRAEAETRGFCCGAYGSAPASRSACSFAPFRLPLVPTGAAVAGAKEVSLSAMACSSRASSVSTTRLFPGPKKVNAATNTAMLRTPVAMMNPIAAQHHQ